VNLVWLIFVFPLVGFAWLTFARERMSSARPAIVGVGSIGLSALVTAHVVSTSHRSRKPRIAKRCGRGCRSARSRRRSPVKLDALSLTMLGVITGVGFFIHLFACVVHARRRRFRRFFSYMNLFIASMLFLVLADDLLFLYFGWEGVGLCSYLLIGFWYKDPANCDAAARPSSSRASATRR
jgi:NADH-quinone oxidoreductase subunit L